MGNHSPWYSFHVLDETFLWDFCKQHLVDVSENSPESVTSANHLYPTCQVLAWNPSKNKLDFWLTLLNFRNLKLWNILKNASAMEFNFTDVAGQASVQVKSGCRFAAWGKQLYPTNTLLQHFLNFETCGKSGKYTEKIINKVTVSLVVFQNLRNTRVWFLLLSLKTFKFKDKALSLKFMSF